MFETSVFSMFLPREDLNTPTQSLNGWQSTVQETNQKETLGGWLPSSTYFLKVINLSLLGCLKKTKTTQVHLCTQADPSKGAVSLQCGITIGLGRSFSPVQLLWTNYSHEGLPKSHLATALTASTSQTHSGCIWLEWYLFVSLSAHYQSIQASHKQQWICVHSALCSWKVLVLCLAEEWLKPGEMKSLCKGSPDKSGNTDSKRFNLPGKNTAPFPIKSKCPNKVDVPFEQKKLQRLL